MPYTATTWNTGDTITATKLNNLETQYSSALDQPKARAYRSSNHVTTDVTEAALFMTAESYDNDSIHSTSSNTNRMTATEGGTYHCVAWVKFNAGGASAGGIRRIRFRKNGSTYYAGQSVELDSGSEIELSVSDYIPLAATDYIELMIYTDSGVSETIASNNNFVEIRRVGP